mmetsp:Transcript_24808/g.37446  ORF Transcript_24808/g.37446 Transcript_24808/m.37446 type:complete len:391 (+) Transcript_24808:136-1308(+)|eukprot:CAMPEP_0194238004 /NCGR_PEP_ID=MMETSP0158-20130606/4855_1 /TAXON_ID=33649 /ORGANISM="Thalassionema nitzschioides, Strain L26-B" /LENGTH=390 /DNA_ID=CAMNT_0038972163 /DNA_START=103 /DNA_END=1278 /DNA_ORIENTATION=-
MAMMFKLLLLLQLEIITCFPLSSSKSSKKNRFQPKKLRPPGGGGFGGGPVDKTTYTRDESPEILGLVDFLSSHQSLGLDPSNGGAIEVGFSEEGRRGLYCTTSLKKNEIICQIPSDYGLALTEDPNDDLTIVQAAANFLRLYQKHPEASQQWKPILDALPQSLKDSQVSLTPDYYTDEELELLEFPPLIQQIKKRQKELNNLANEHDDLSLEELQFATHLVSSRSVAIPLSDISSDPALDEEGRPLLKAGKNLKVLRVLIPFLDLANHASLKNANCEFHLIDPEQDEAWFSLRTTRKIPAGRELCVAYGTTGIESSSDILRDYGFCPTDHGPVDKLMLKKLKEQEPAAYPKWTTTSEEDNFMLQEAEGRLATILNLRASLKFAEIENNKE